MTPYHVYFLPIFLVGCLIAVIASFFASRNSGCSIPGALLALGVLSFWVGLFIGSDVGYRAWQSMPDPPKEAFSDASAMGALVFGWFPGGVFCLAFFGFFRGIRFLIYGSKPEPGTGKPNSRQANSQPVETGNPYQGPQSTNSD